MSSFYEPKGNIKTEKLGNNVWKIGHALPKRPLLKEVMYAIFPAFYVPVIQFISLKENLSITMQT